MNAQWRKSSRSGGESHDNCVELACLGSATGVRDSKNSAGPVLTFPQANWASFLERSR